MLTILMILVTVLIAIERAIDRYEKHFEVRDSG